MSETYKGEPIKGDFTGKHIISIDQFERDDIDLLFTEAKETGRLVEEQDGTDLLRRKRLTNLFYEPSTRTSSSFHFAMEAHGGSVKSIENVEYSSVAKGESLQDTVRSLEQYAHLTVVRHPKVGAVAVAAEVAEKPIINGGDGAGEHPTQALLDLFTILEKQGKIDGLNITLLGDLKNGRTVHSLAKLLSKYEVQLNYVSPKELAMPTNYVNEINDRDIRQNIYTNLDDVLPESDILYVTRVQGERFLDQAEYHRLKDTFRITLQVLENAKDSLSVMHPLPRVGEIATEVDNDPRAAYFDEMKFGMYVRMALMAKVLGKSVLIK